MSTLRRLASLFAATPLHPQWLLGRRKVEAGFSHVSGRLLDIGAGGRWLESRLPDAVTYVALDFPPTGEALYHASPDVFGNAMQLPFADNSFDAVACLEVLEHVPDPDRVLTEIHRVLKSEGRAWISMPFMYPLHDAPFDYQRFTEYGLRRSVQNAGLEIAHLRKTGHAISVAGVMACLALAGGVERLTGWRKWCLLPLAVFGVFCVNILSWLLGRCWPDWAHMAVGHQLEVYKTQS